MGTNTKQTIHNKMKTHPLLSVARQVIWLNSPVGNSWAPNQLFWFPPGGKGTELQVSGGLIQKRAINGTSFP